MRAFVHGLFGSGISLCVGAEMTGEAPYFPYSWLQMSAALVVGWVVAAAIMHRKKIAITWRGRVFPVFSEKVRYRIVLHDLSSELRQAMEILQSEGRQHGLLGDTERGWGAVRIVATKLDQIGIPHPSIEPDELAWRWWSFLTCLIPYTEARDLEGAQSALAEMLKIKDPLPYPWDREE